MCLLVAGDVTADGRPIARPRRRSLPRGAFHFGSRRTRSASGTSRTRPHVSATHLPGEEFAVTVHGRAVPVDSRGAGGRRVAPDAARGLRSPLRARWVDFLDGGPVYARIEADNMFTFQMNGRPGFQWRAGAVTQKTSNELP